MTKSQIQKMNPTNMQGRVLWIDPNQIKIGWRARTDLGDINHLAGSIAATGQAHPIVVTRTADGFEVVAGVRRMTACKQLGRMVGVVVVNLANEHAAVALQLEENMSRKDFDELEMAEGLARLKALHVEAHPETRHGAHGGGRKGGVGAVTKAELSKSDNPASRFSLEAARLIGCSESRVKELLQVADLPKRAKKKIVDAKTTTERRKLARQALSHVRLERKKAKLVEAAEEKAAERTEGGNLVVLKLMDNTKYFATADPDSVDLVFTDPPFGQRKSKISHGGARKDIDTDFGKWDILDVGWVVKVEPLIDDGGQLLIFSPIEGVGLYKAVCESLGLDWRGTISWHKTNPGTAHRAAYLSTMEAVCWATKGKGYHFGPFENAGGPEAHNFREGAICGGNERLDHPTQKPEWLLRDLLERHTSPHSRVLDPFCGVGSTLAVCKQMGLACVGVERDEGYVHQARLRLGAI